MPEEHDDDSYSSFWPLTILLTGVLLWNGFQYYQIFQQRTAINQQIDGLAQGVNNAQAAQTRLVSFASDLLQTASKDSAAAQIVRDAKDAGILQLNPAPPAGTDTNAASAMAPSSEPGK